MGKQRVSRHNGRSGKNGAYNSKHNDRQFDTAKAEHIDTARMQLNIYWDYRNGLRSHAEHESGKYPSFTEVEKQFYTERYSDFIAGQHERNRKTGHSKRNRSIDDLLRDKRVCPEETIYQIGKKGSETPPEILLEVLNEYHDRFNQRFGKHVHIINWSLHLDEKTPHVHERHVFDVINSHGEIEPKQEKALIAMGIPVPDPNKDSGKFNNRKMTFDAICREMLIDICKAHDLDIEEEPIYGGQAYREKNDFIIESQQAEITEQQQLIVKQLAQQEQNDDLLTQQHREIDQNEALLNDEKTFIASIASQAYDKAIDITIDDTVREIQEDTARAINSFKERNTGPDKKLKPAVRDAIIAYLDSAISMVRKRTDKLISWIRQKLFMPEVRTENVKKIEKEMTPSIREQIRSFRQRERKMPAKQEQTPRDEMSR